MRSLILATALALAGCAVPQKKVWYPTSTAPDEPFEQVKARCESRSYVTGGVFSTISYKSPQRFEECMRGEGYVHITEEERRKRLYRELVGD